MERCLLLFDDLADRSKYHIFNHIVYSIFFLSSVPDLGGPNPMNGYMMMMLGWVFVATLLYFLRPNALRPQGNEKPSPSGGGVSTVVVFFGKR